MNELSRIAFALGISLFQSILFIRFACSCLHFRSKIRHRVWLLVLTVGVLTVCLAEAELFSVFKGFPMLASGSILLVFAVIALEGSAVRKFLVAVLPGIMAAAGYVLASGFMLLATPGADTGIFTSILANGILLAVYKKVLGICNGKTAVLTPLQMPAFHAQLGFSVAVFLLLYYGEHYGSARLVKLLLCAGILCLLLWNFVMYRILAAMQKKTGEELEDRLLKQEKTNQLRVDELKYQYETLQKAKHDFKNTLSVLKSLNAERKPAQIDAYIDAYLETAHVGAAFVTSENEYANAIINAKTQEARSHGIDVKIVITSPIASSDPVDICNVLGNLFDNAIAACLKVKDNRRISLHIYDQGEETVFCMKNSIAYSVLEYNPELKTDKEDKVSHGYGTRIIREIAQKHRGFADFYEEGGEFCCNVVMYL